MDGAGNMHGSFDQFFVVETSRLVAFLRKAGFGTEQSRDSAQEAMMLAFQNWGNLQFPRAWVRTTAYRTACAEAVSASRTFLAAVGGFETDRTTDPDVVVLAEERDELLRALGRLGRAQRLVLAWSLDGFDTNEIATNLDVRPATVRSNLRHARAKLKALHEAKVAMRGGL